MSKSLSNYDTAQGLNISPYVGKQITTINGVDAMTFVKVNVVFIYILNSIQNFAATIGTYKDLPVQFNAAIASFGPFTCKIRY